MSAQRKAPFKVFDNLYYVGFQTVSVYLVTTSQGLVLLDAGYAETVDWVLESVRTELHNRRKGDAVRLEIDQSAPAEIIERLRTNFELAPEQVFRTDGPVNLSRLMNLYSEVKLPTLKFIPFAAKEFKLSAKSTDIFDELRNRDVLLHHPFESFQPVAEFLRCELRDADAARHHIAAVMHPGRSLCPRPDHRRY